MALRELISYTNDWLAKNANETFERHGIPVRISPYSQMATDTIWRVELLPGAETQDHVLQRLYFEEDAIIGRGFTNITSEEALFLAMSYFFQWLARGASTLDPLTGQIFNVINTWILLHQTRGGVVN